jgi:DNA-binding GntR family transcriptional regulator
MAEMSAEARGAGIQKTSTLCQQIFGSNNLLDSKLVSVSIFAMRHKSSPLSPLTASLPSGRPPTVAEYVTDSLRQRIVDGTLGSGTELRQEEIAARLNVSRMPVREALRVLQSEGWVDMEPRRGAVVARFDATDIREAFALRAVVEVDALRRAFPTLEQDDFATAEALLDQLDEADDAVVYSRLHKAFHLALTAKAGRRYRTLISDLLDAADRYLRIELGGLSNHAESQAEHRAVLAAARRGDVEAAVFVLHPHIAEAGEELASLIEAKAAKPS